MTQPQRPLDDFEGALLTELRTLVTERSSHAAPAHSPDAAPAPVPLLRRRSVRWLGSVAAVSAAITGLTLLPGRGSPAYAVSTDASGEVRVTVNRLDDAKDLEQALANQGIRADVTFLPVGKQCAEGRFAPGTPGGSGRFDAPSGADGSQTFTISPNMVGAGETLVLSSMRPNADSWALQVGVASGTVAPCIPVDASLPKAPAGPGSGSRVGGGTVVSTTGPLSPANGGTR
jgi:hypothetical protein